jgi:hypothetical protein
MESAKRKLMLLASTLLVLSFMVSCTEKKIKVAPEEAKSIATEAYTYGFPMIDSYRIFYAYFIDKLNPEYKGPFNTILNEHQVYTPEDKAVQTPNSDTPYSMLGLDLRSEPVVLTLPVIDPNRYFSVQLVDMYTFNFDYMGSRTTGNNGGNFLIAGPGWNGETPAGITKVFHCETEFALAIFRTQLFGPDDMPNVIMVQDGYKLQPLSAFLGTTAPAAAPAVDFMKPLSKDEEKTSLEFYNLLNFLLKFCPTDPSETALMEKFAKIDVGAGRKIDFDKMSPELKQAFAGAIQDSWKAFDQFAKTDLATGKVTSGDIFGTRAYLKNNYLYRMAAAVFGIYGNSKDEAMYPVYKTDATGQPLSGAYKYTVTLSPESMPPVNAFWSFTMYELPQSLLTANPINRYLINSPMLPDLKKDANGNITLYIQNESPGKDLESNWLPAPTGPFQVVLRLYWPKPAALDGTWKQPAMEVVK